jgi:hypothetical protein
MTKISAAAHELGLDKLKPIHEFLSESVSYEQLRIAITALRNLANSL